MYCRKVNDGSHWWDELSYSQKAVTRFSCEINSFYFLFNSRQMIWFWPSWTKWKLRKATSAETTCRPSVESTQASVDRSSTGKRLASWHTAFSQKVSDFISHCISQSPHHTFATPIQDFLKCFPLESRKLWVLLSFFVYCFPYCRFPRFCQADLVYGDDMAQCSLTQ